MKWNKWAGWIFFVLALGLFCLQLGYFYVHNKFQAGYVDDRLFYIITIGSMFCLLAAILLLVKPARKFTIIFTGAAAVVILLQIVLLVTSNKQIKNITSVSPDWRHVLSIKVNQTAGDAVYYRSYYGILARPKERLPYDTADDFKVEWLVKDIAAVTYKTANNTIQQFIATYGDRGGGTSYYYVGAEIHGRWKGKNTSVRTEQEGITVTVNGRSEQFDWDNIEQFGTLAIVLKKGQEAVWTIALNPDFKVHANAAKPMTGTIQLYRATMKDNQPVTLHYAGDQGNEY